MNIFPLMHGRSNFVNAWSRTRSLICFLINVEAPDLYTDEIGRGLFVSWSRVLDSPNWNPDVSTISPEWSDGSRHGHLRLSLARLIRPPHRFQWVEEHIRAFYPNDMSIGDRDRLATSTLLSQAYWLAADRDFDVAGLDREARHAMAAAYTGCNSLHEFQLALWSLGIERVRRTPR